MRMENVMVRKNISKCLSIFQVVYPALVLLWVGVLVWSMKYITFWYLIQQLNCDHQFLFAFGVANPSLTKRPTYIPTTNNILDKLASKFTEKKKSRIFFKNICTYIFLYLWIRSGLVFYLFIRLIKKDKLNFPCNANASCSFTKIALTILIFFLPFLCVLIWLWVCFGTLFVHSF